MSLVEKIVSVLKKPNKIINYLGNRGYLMHLSDNSYLKLMYRCNIGKKLDLKNPTTFNEKLQWLKINDRNQLYTNLADKYEVREFIKEKIGEKYLIPLIGVYSSFEDINFNELPKQFVLKTTHDSGGIVICKDKNKFDINLAKEKINRSLSTNYYNRGREWQYKDITPRIICEKYMVDESNIELKDYKFFCFDGEPKVLYIVSGRDNDTRGDFYDMEFNRIELKVHNENSNIDYNKPNNFEQMINICRKLSKDIPHIRVDLYNINGNIYFGELTLHHNSGLRKFEPEYYDKVFGNWIKIDLSKI